MNQKLKFPVNLFHRTKIKVRRLSVGDGVVTFTFGSFQQKQKRKTFHSPEIVVTKDLKMLRHTKMG